MNEFAKKIEVFDQFYKYLESEIKAEIEIKEREKKLENKLENTPKRRYGRCSSKLPWRVYTIRKSRVSRQQHKQSKLEGR